MPTEPTPAGSQSPGVRAELDERLDGLWHVAALARALGGDPDAPLTSLSAAVASAAGLASDELTAQECAELLNEIRTNLQQAATFAAGESLSGWDPDDEILTSQGRASRRVAALMLDVVGGRFPELVDQLAAPGARFLDVGVRVAQISIELCQRLPDLRVTGVDVNPRPLRLAAHNVAADELSDRIELRQADVADLDEAEVYTLAWIPMPFLPPAVVLPALRAIHRALRPGGWLLAACSGPDADPLTGAMNRLRAAILGGGHHSAADTAALLADLDFADIHQLSPAPGQPAGLVLARKA